MLMIREKHYLHTDVYNILVHKYEWCTQQFSKIIGMYTSYCYVCIPIYNIFYHQYLGEKVFDFTDGITSLSHRRILETKIILQVVVLGSTVTVHRVLLHNTRPWPPFGNLIDGSHWSVFFFSLFFFLVIKRCLRVPIPIYSLYR